MSEPEPTDGDLERARAEAAAADGKRACEALLCGKFLYPEDGVVVEDVFLCRDCVDEDL